LGWQIESAFALWKQGKDSVPTASEKRTVKYVIFQYAMFTDSHLANMPTGKLYFLFASLSLVQIVFSQAPSTFPLPLSLSLSFSLSVCHLLSPSFSYLSPIFCPVFSLYPYSISCFFLFCLSSFLFHQIFHPPLAYSISAPSPKPPFCNIPQLQTHTESSLLTAFPIIELELSQTLN